MVSSFGISALEAIKKIKGFENAVIAGGFIRDHVLGLDFKDVDIFVPCSDVNVFTQAFINASEPVKEKVLDNNYVTMSSSASTTYTLTQALTGAQYWNTSSLKKKKGQPEYIKDIKFDKFSDWKFEMSGKGGYMKDKLYLGKMKGKYAGVIDVEVMCYNLPNNEDFGKKLVKNFSYNIDMIYFDGVDIRQTKEFTNDRNYGYATLSRLDTLDELPGAMAKFFRFKEKAPNFVWKCSLLELKNKKEEKNKKKATDDRELKIIDDAIPIREDWWDEAIDAAQIGDQLPQLDDNF